MNTENIYQEHGYKSRLDYLQCLAEDYGVPLGVVKMLSNILGMDEDFDDLINALEDYEGY